VLQSLLELQVLLQSVLQRAPPCPVGYNPHVSESPHAPQQHVGLAGGVGGGVGEWVDTCQGDSGGALLCLRGNSWVKFGVVSYGIGCADKNFPGVYTDMRDFFDWIQEAQQPDYNQTRPFVTTIPITHSPTPIDTTTPITTPFATTEPVDTTPQTTEEPATTTHFVPSAGQVANAVREMVKNINPIPRLLSFWFDVAEKDDRYIDETHASFLAHVARVQRQKHVIDAIRKMKGRQRRIEIV